MIPTERDLRNMLVLAVVLTVAAGALAGGSLVALLWWLW